MDSTEIRGLLQDYRIKSPNDKYVTRLSLVAFSSTYHPAAEFRNYLRCCHRTGIDFGKRSRLYEVSGEILDVKSEEFGPGSEESR